MANFGPIRLAHEPDIAWILALWYWIHDGDPGPVDITLDARTAVLADEFVGYLARAIKPEKALPTIEAMQERLHRLGLPLTLRESTHEQSATEELRVVPGIGGGDEGPGCCVGMGGRIVCVHLKAAARQ